MYNFTELCLELTDLLRKAKPVSVQLEHSVYGNSHGNSFI